MNHHYVNNSTALLQFRLRTARHKKRMQYKDWNKQLLALQREQNNLYKQQRCLGWIDLHPAVVRGWKRYFVLSNDVAGSKQAPFFESILSKINTTQFSYRKDFKVKKRKWGKKVHIVKEQHLLHPYTFQFNTFNFSELEKQFFDERLVRNTWTGKQDRIFVFTEPWRFVLRVRPNIITKARARNEVMESRLRQISNYIEHNALRGRINHLTGGHHYSWWRGEKEKEKNPLKNKPLTAILDAFYTKAHDT